ncbi:MAG: hypothetical protein UX72_C0015G0016 [Parcubacteria group bacterium GW2011_GWA2_47_10]|nr:MAG: hypothetical protein UX72_C0015G0016 [Parcubacteria group bacterium GW2011_GWA2_47_10]
MQDRFGIYLSIETSKGTITIPLERAIERILYDTHPAYLPTAERLCQILKSKALDGNKILTIKAVDQALKLLVCNKRIIEVRVDGAVYYAWPLRREDSFTFDL